MTGESEKPHRLCVLTAERLRELLIYDPLTGVFTWRVSRRHKTRAGSIAGSLCSRGYRDIQIDGISYRAHRLAWLYVHGEWPPSDLDHKDTVHDHNWIDNLRPATNSQNRANTRREIRNTSGFKGVSRYTRRCGVRWRAYIQKDGKMVHLGSFLAPELAHAAYTAAAQQMFGEFARTE